MVNNWCPSLSSKILASRLFYLEFQTFILVTIRKKLFGSMCLIVWHILDRIQFPQSISIFNQGKKEAIKFKRKPNAQLRRRKREKIKNRRKDWGEKVKEWFFFISRISFTCTGWRARRLRDETKASFGWSERRTEGETDRQRLTDKRTDRWREEQTIGQKDWVKKFDQSRLSG